MPTEADLIKEEDTTTSISTIDNSCRAETEVVLKDNNNNNSNKDKVAKTINFKAASADSE